MIGRRARSRGPQPPWALLSLLLRYPEDDLNGLRGELDALPDGPVRDALVCFLDEVGGDIDLRAVYVDTFETRRRITPYLTYYEHGDTRRRGVALLRLKRLYREAGLPLDCAELPDHLAVILAFAALAPPGYGEQVLAEHRTSLELLRLALHDADSPYRHVVDAVAALLPALGIAERAGVAQLVQHGPPDEMVGLEPFAPPEVMPTGAHP